MKALCLTVLVCIFVGCNNPESKVQTFATVNQPTKSVPLPIIDNELIRATISTALADRCFDDPSIDSAIKAVADQCDRLSREAPSIELQKMWAREALEIRKIIPAAAQATSQPSGSSVTQQINDAVVRATVAYALTQRCFSDTGYIPTLKTIGDKCSKLGVKQASKTLAIRKILSDWDKRPKLGGSLQVSP